ncbi:MAG: 3-hydroxyacyl-CoA dehydrogenase/enoyl-CoA hydratase family protein [Saprospiraceae bacterium]|nr:3-hydroxyacyl-CoA dehydrogenase/enoyl-CoA hydratase family protein [Saprospiraceae bacterium]
MRRIKKVAVLGSGVMGSGIAAHLTNIGLEVLLLDIVPFDLKENEKDNPAARNRIVNAALKAAIKNRKPVCAFYDTKTASKITTGNFTDDFEKISDCDWIIEVVIERLDIKQQIFEKVDKYRKPGSLVTSNTSGIPINLMSEGRSEDFQKNFCGTHFFNPPRILRLLEIIPGPKTDQSVIDFFMHYGDVYLGKRPVLCKDTPAFIANRVGVYAMAKIFQLTEQMGLSIEAVDRLTGSAIGRPRTGTFALGDLVGLDTAEKVIKGIVNNCPDDEQAGAFTMPKYLSFLLENKFLGNKTKKGFYYRGKDENGKRVKYALNLQTLEYAPAQRPSFPSLDAAKQSEDLKGKIRTFFSQKDGAYRYDDAGAQLIRESLLGLFAYVSNRIPEIADDVYSIDDALRAGFAWDVGPFQYWDMVGVAEGLAQAKAAGLELGAWVQEMVDAGHTSFYKVENGVTMYYDIASKSYKAVPGMEEFIVLDNIRQTSVVWENAGSQLHDIGDGVLCFEFRSKMNTLGADVLMGLNEAIKIAEEGDWKGLVIGNNSVNFSVGANLMAIAGLAYEAAEEGDYTELEYAVRMFQNTTMRARYSSIPVVVATQGYVFGGGCELSMHSDCVVAAAESYVGLVEAGVGLIPGGGGTKEFALRASEAFHKDGVKVPHLIDRFAAIVNPTPGNGLATSAAEAFKIGFLREGVDRVSVNVRRNIGEAKKAVLELADNYSQPAPKNDIYVLGRSGLGALYVAAESFRLGGFASDHDVKIAKKVAYVLCGGDLTAPQKVSEQYLLDIEREAFLSLCGEQKTLERIAHMLQTNKPLRN